MKKLGVSIFALLVSLPMAARAQLGTFNSTAMTADDGTTIATTKYVKGAYNTLATAINANESAIASKQAAIDSEHKLSADLINDTNSDNKFVTEQEKTAIGTISGKQAQLVNDDNEPANISHEVLTSVGSTGDDTHLVTEKAVRDAIDAATTGMVTSTDLNAKQDVIDSSHKLSANLVDDSQSTNKFVTATDKTTWNAKQAALTNGTDAVDTTVKTTIAATNASDTALVTESAVRSAINDLNLSTTYQAKNDSTVATGTYNHIAQGSGVATNLVNLDTAMGKVATTGTYNKISASNSVAANLIALDAAIGNMETQWTAPSVGE